MYEIDEQQLRQWWQVFNPQDKLVEIRLLGKNTYSGYFKDIETLITQIRPLLDHLNLQYYGAMQAYFTLNEINEDLYSREQHDIFVKKPKSTTTDGDIARRRMILVDLDPTRSAGISASNEEYEKAHLKAVAIYRYLISEGFNEPIITTSGNGYHLYLPCDIVNDDEHNELIKRFLQALGMLFSDESVEIDEKVFNPARIDKLIGTWAKKGSDTKERPWRISRILKVPENLDANDEALFEKIAQLAPKEEPRVAPNRRPNNMMQNGQFDLRAWLNQYGIVYREEMQGNSTKFVLQHCPWEDTHSSVKEWESALFLAQDGQITFSCFHSHCKNRTWFDFRQFYEPDAYNKPQYTPQGTYSNNSQSIKYQQAKPRYEIKDEIPELGEKWLTLEDIEEEDLTQLEKFKTGILELDKRIGGLYVSEVSVFSGNNSSGKSSFLNTLILNFCEHNVPTALFSAELKAGILKTWINMPAAGVHYLKQSQYDDGRYYVPKEVSQKIQAWTGKNLFIYNNKYGSEAEQVLHDIEILAKAGVKMFVLDNLMAIGIDFYEGDKNAKQKSFILKVKAFAMKYNVHVILVAHPRKSLAFLRKADISGTGDISNAVDNVFIMHRVNEDFIHAITDYYDAAMASRLKIFGNVLSVEKNRMYGICDYMCGLYYDLISRRFKNTEYEDIHYGWEQIGTQQTIHYQEVERKVDEEEIMFGGQQAKSAPF